MTRAVKFLTASAILRKAKELNMRKKDLQEARIKTDKEISEAMAKKSAELAASKFKAATGEAKNIKIGRNLRREIAQLATILREKSLGGKQ